MVTKYPTLGMSREDWLEARRGSIGGSDAATVLGLNPYSSPYALWAEKTGVVSAPDISDREAVRLGNFLEPYVAQRFTEITGKKVRRENYILRNPEYPWAHANVDRMVIGEKAGLECKTTSALNLRKFKNGEYPANYYCQCVHYMAVTGAEKWYLAVLIGNQEIRIFEILRDEDEIRALMDAERRFWRHVEERTPPETDGISATGDTLEAQYPEEDPEVTIDLTPVCGVLRVYLDTKAQIKELERQLDGAANAIKAYMGSAAAGTYEGSRVTWKTIRSRRFDRDAFERDHPGVDMRKYTKETAGRRFEVKGENTL